MASRRPLVSIGLPVYNGELYIGAALDSIRSQTYDNFEVIISDNASTDKTAVICRDYVSRDARIQFYQNNKNLGASWNYNRVFELSSGEYFKWAAHDDILAPEFLERCIHILEQDPSIILCHSKVRIIDKNNQLVGTYESEMSGSQSKPDDRFNDLLLTKHPCTAAFGVIRRNTLRRTPLIGAYVGSDINLLGELALLGRLYEIPEYLFYRREHPQSSIRVLKYHERLVWFDPRKGDRIDLPNWKNGIEFFRSVNRVPLNWFEKLLCYRVVCIWFLKKRSRLIKDVKRASFQILIQITGYKTKSQRAMKQDIRK